MLITRLLATLNTLLVISLLFSASLSRADEMTATDYIVMDLQTRQITLEGVKERLRSLEIGTDLGAQLENDNNTQKLVDEIYQRNGLTSSSAIAWATQHAKTIADELLEQPNQQAEYDRIASELDSVSAEIQSLVN